MEKQDIAKGKTTAIIAYLTIIGTIIAIFMNQDDNKSNFASFHIRQGLGISLTYFLLGYIVGNFDNWTISIAFWLAITILWVYGFLGCINNQERVVPLIGQYFQTFFKSL